MAEPEILHLPDRASDEATRRLVLAGGYSRTIAGALKILIGLVLKVTGWALSDTLQHETAEALAVLVGIGLELWGVSQVMHARHSRGDVSLTGKRLRPVETVVLPTRDSR